MWLLDQEDFQPLTLEHFLIISNIIRLVQLHMNNAREFKVVPCDILDACLEMLMSSPFTLERQFQFSGISDVYFGVFSYSDLWF